MLGWLMAVPLASAIAQSDCSTVIALSKLSQTTVEDRKSVEAASAAFCDEYSKSVQSGKAMSASASYKFLAASYGSSSVSAEQVASRYCSMSASFSRREDAYRQYVETIAPDAYKAYESCLAMQNNSVNMAVSALTPKTFQMVVGFAPKDENAKATLGVSGSPGVSCKWGGAGIGMGKVFTAAGTDTLMCVRDDSRTAEFVTVVKTSGVGSTMTVPWGAMDESGYALDALGKLQAQVQELQAELAQQRQQASTLAASLAAVKAEGSQATAAVNARFGKIAPTVLCSGDGWFPRPAAPTCPSGSASSGEFTHSAPGGKAGFGGNCRVCISTN
ncbi:hypothetical protein M4R22_20750 [Acidovorax sp. GBBC 3334]|uniref:hypothetical protein n=1 Tax=Acidovorax sp. GBBC 3334 TaxID=2940496 RepID=UPI002303D03D|nr:hypothetical protein [Acidovorax sp. GBBC 3334]MDA8457194.1 hypothetical protein [Acidovorax sp. GBBC 3334]